MSEDLKLEKINAERITALEQRVDQKLDSIHDKIDRFIENVNKSKGKDSFDWKAVGLVLTFLALAFGLVENQILTDAKIAEKGFNILGDNFATYMAQHEKSQDTRMSQAESEILRIRNWKDETEKNIPKLESEIMFLWKAIEIKSADRFTGTQAAQMQSQIDRYEDRLTYLTKEWINLQAKNKASEGS